MIERAFKVCKRLNQFIRENKLKLHELRIAKSSKTSMVRSEKIVLLKHDVLTFEDRHVFMQILEILKLFKIWIKHFEGNHKNDTHEALWKIPFYSVHDYNKDEREEKGKQLSCCCWSKRSHTL